MSASNERRGIFYNTVAQSASMVLAFGLSFLLAPLLIARLGLAEFGVWAVTGALAQYAALADLGITRALARYIALFDSRGDERSIKQCVGLGLIVVTIVEALAITAAITLAPVVSDALGILDPGQMRIVLLGSAGILGATLFRLVFNSVGVGLRIMGPPNVAVSTNSILNFSFSVAILLISPTLPHYALANAAAEWLGVIASLVMVRFVWKGGFPVALPSRALAKELLLFGIKAQVHWIAEMVNLQTDKVIIAMVAGVRVTAAYELAARVVQAARILSTLAVSAIIPAATAHIEKLGRAAIAGFYERYTRLSVSLGYPIMVLSCISAPFLLMAWLGRSPPDSVAVLVLLGLSYFLNMSVSVAYTVAIGAGRPGLTARVDAFTALLNIALTAGLAPLFSFWGVLVGTLIAITCGSALFIFSFHRAYGIPRAAFTRAVALPAAVALALGLPEAVFGALAAPHVHSRPVAAAMLVGVVSVYGLTYWLVASRLALLPERLRAERLLRRRAVVAGAESA